MHYRLVFNGMLYELQSNALRHRTATILERQDFESLVILFSSEGGSTDQSLALYNFFRELPVPVHMHGVGHVGSASIPVFLAGNRRTCTPMARFFFHAYDWAFEGRQMSDRIAEALQRLHSDIELSREIAARHTRLTPERLNKLYSTSPTPTIFTPQEAMEAGIIEEVRQLNPASATQTNVAVWTVGW
jgi:ATP-dependent protease ClpP protease subunit